MTRADFSTGVDTTERLGPDDLATLREAQHLQAALAAQRLRAQRGAGDKPGTCSNCGAACLPRATWGRPAFRAGWWTSATGRG